MIRRLVGLISIAGALALLLAGNGAAEAPAGPRLTFQRHGEVGFELVSVDPLGQDQRLLAGGFGPEALDATSRAAWSADGSHFAFDGITEAVKEGQLDICMANADGSGVTVVPGTREGSEPVLSPDGRELAFTRWVRHSPRKPRHRKAKGFVGESIWLLDLQTGATRQLTPWRNEVFTKPSSFTPNGAKLAYTWEKGFEAGGPLPAAIAVRVDGSGSTVLRRGAREPAYSPDGTRLALAVYGKRKRGSKRRSSTELAIARADGSGLKKLTSTPGFEGEPSWDPSGQRLAYSVFRFGPASGDPFGISSSLREINADGSCEITILSEPKTLLYGPAWQPGPGREAGPIAC